MKNAKIVIGANFGDEGKGLTTDYLSMGGNDPIVVRFNGGAQAGHTVQTIDNKAHVFHHVGSGSFLDIPTFLSKFFIVNPTAFVLELEELEALSMKPRLYLDIRAPLTTPYDMIINWAIETKRGNSRHGSCGFGIDQTMRFCPSSFLPNSK